MRQVKTPNFNFNTWFWHADSRGVAYKQTYRGWCLKFVDDAGGVATTAPPRLPSAQAALNAEKKAKRLRTTALPLNVWVPIFFEFRSGPFTRLGHVALAKRKSNGSVEIRDSETHTKARSVYTSIQQVIYWFGAYSPAYVGWSTHCSGRKYAEPKPAPKPPATGSFKVVKQLNGYRSAADAKARRNSNSKVPAGSYHTFNTHSGMRNITRKAGTPGWWINPADNKASASQTLTVRKGEGISHLAIRAKYSDWSKESRWAAIAKLNGSNNWRTFNSGLKAGQKVRVK